MVVLNLLLLYVLFIVGFDISVLCWISQKLRQSLKSKILVREDRKGVGVTCSGHRAGGAGVRSRQRVSSAHGLLNCFSVCGLPRLPFVRIGTRAAGWLADCLIMILDGPEMVPLQTFLFPPSAPWLGDWVFAGDLHNLKFCGNWAAFLTEGTE